jgi:hypothetical protein
MGVILKDFELGEPFELGVDASFTAATDGRLFLRVLDDFTSLADNSGSLEITVGRAP